jgi:hypothetical protein
MRNYRRPAKVLVAILGVFILVGASLARDERRDERGDVLAPDAKVHGYSLTEAAEATAAFNTGSPIAPNVPFQFLSAFQATPYTVKAGTFFYLPFFNADNAPPVLGKFPDDVRCQEADADYFFDPANGIGLEVLDITVDDDRTVSLGPDYVVGVDTPPLPDGGTQYVVCAAFLAPLSKGTHTITLHGELDGAAALAAGIPAVFDTTITVIVQ